jgi:hypothetical protein
MDETTTFRGERLELIFTCCHPALALDAQVALSLRALGGLSTEEIALAFLVPFETMSYRTGWPVRHALGELLRGEAIFRPDFLAGAVGNCHRAAGGQSFCQAADDPMRVVRASQEVKDRKHRLNQTDGASQADSAGSIPVIRSNVKAQVGSGFRTLGLW